VTRNCDSSAPGIFTADETGTGGASAVHLNGSLVTASNPATVGETIAVFGSGLGTVTPAVADGAPVGTLSATNDTFDLFVDGQQATVSFSGLSPTFAGLYQVNFVVPDTTVSGAVSLDISDEFTGAHNSMAILYVSGATTNQTVPKTTDRLGTHALHNKWPTSQTKAFAKRKRAVILARPGS
jgi:uncharacterized protein (TIGR03437 family)